MYKIKTTTVQRDKRAIIKYLSIMKLTSLLLIWGMFQGTAATLGQSITLNKTKLSYGNLFREIQQQTGFDIFLHSSKFDLEKSRKVAFNKASLKEVLDWVKSNEKIDYTINGKSIILHSTASSTKNNLTNASVIQQNVNGIVKDKAGKPIAGVTVSITDNSSKTSTDQDGKFELNAVEPNASIVFTMLGYKEQTVSLQRRGSIEIVLEESQIELSDVTVVSTGFQTISKERATGSFGTVSKEQLEKPSLSIAQRIIGTTPGVQARLDIDGKPRFEIRGQSSLFADAAPLVVVDGFPIQGDFESINPNDVESVTILKDAAAASIWGARAANGVIVVVTRNANKNSSLKVDFQAFARIGSKMDLDYINPLASSSQTVEYEKMAFNKWGAEQITGVLNNDARKSWSPASVLLAEYHLGYISLEDRDAGLERLKSLSNKRQISDNLLSNPINQQYNLSLQGSSGKMNNFMSVLYEKNQSNFQRTNSEKYLINFRNNTQLLKWLRLDLAAMLNINNNNNSGITLTNIDPSIAEVGIKDIAPYEMLLDEEGNYNNISQYYWPAIERDVPTSRFPYANWGFNPIQEINNRDLTAKALNTRLQAGLSISPIKGLTYDLKGQYELFNTQTRNYYGPETFFVRKAVNEATSWDRNTDKLTTNLNKGAFLDQNRDKVTSWNIRNQLSYNSQIGLDHALNAVVGSEISNRVIEYFENPRAYGYNDETLTLGAFPNGPGGPFALLKDWMGANQTFTYTNAFAYGTQRFVSLFGNAAYTYKNKYTISGSLRTDASNLITDDPKYRYSPFWSVGGSWNIGKETFVEKTDWFDKLMLRLTYGYNGNVDPTTAFRPLIAVTSIPSVFTNDYTATISSFGNPTLRWEKTGSWNLGIDYAILDNKLYGRIDLYRKNGKDLIAEVSIPAVNGTQLQKLNNAEMQNTGIELELGTRLSIKENDITWNGSVNFSYNKNEITKKFTTNYESYMLVLGSTYSYVEGHDANSLWSYEYAGVKDKQPVIKGEGDAFYNLNSFAPGNAINYMVNSGTTVAPYTLGVINSFKIYDFNFSFIVTGKFGHVFRSQGFDYPVLWTSRLLPNARLEDVVNGDPEKIVPLPLNENEPRYYSWSNFTPHMSYLAANASHIRMQEIYLSYNLPTSRWVGLGSTRASVFFQGNDLYTHTFNNLGEDPEYPLGTLNPRPKFTFGVKASF